MAGPSRVSGFGNYVVGSYRTSANIGAFLVTVKNASASAQDIRAEDDAANEVVEAIMMATNTLGASFADADTGVATILVGFFTSVYQTLRNSSRTKQHRRFWNNCCGGFYINSGVSLS